MSETAFLQNAIARAHHQLRGGRRNAITYSIGYAVIIGGLMVLAVRADIDDTQEILYGWTIALLALQIGILVLYGGSAVRAAIRRDITTGMIASHRLMPMSGTQAVAGYIIGSCPQPLAVAASNFLLGILIAGPAKISPGDWIAANVVLLVFAACSWVVVACASLVSPRSAGAALVALVMFTISGGVVATLIPAFTVVCSPIVGSTIFGIVMKGASWSPMLHMSITAQIVIASFFFIAATRKYQRDDVVAIPPLLGTLILAVYAGISVLGIRHWSALQPAMWNLAGDVTTPQVIGSIVAGFMLSFIPLISAAWLQEDYRRRRLLSDPALGRRPANSILLAFVAALMLTSIPAMVLPRPELTAFRLTATLVCAAATLIPVAYLLRLIYRTRAGISYLLALWIGLAWITPWVIAFGVLVASGIDDTMRIPLGWARSEFVASFSPIGSLISIWTNSKAAPYLVGLFFQIALAALMAIFYHRLRSSATDLRVPVA